MNAKTFDDSISTNDRAEGQNVESRRSGELNSQNKDEAARLSFSLVSSNKPVIIDRGLAPVKKLFLRSHKLALDQSAVANK